MTKDNKKKNADIPNSEERERVSVHMGSNATHPLNTNDRVSGNSVDEHRMQESANAYIAEKEIKQTFLNS
ncbi:hypothetical protein [Oceanobacillus halophilus]|uniref:Uncharacterized protein n=1 Tax=Oceanobacillus halophilus TaxID=930130 RepID=A0A494ZT35_9BACI|nr:hypothetical protein [Oceanobacillus halophilus]RKQ29061.1 hypothetical protein D8M06_18215 [Oceanobacillus halophilus]